MPKFIITKTRTEEYQAEVEADTEDDAWSLLHDDEVEFEFIASDDEFEVSPICPKCKSTITDENSLVPENYTAGGGCISCYDPTP